MKHMKRWGVLMTFFTFFNLLNAARAEIVTHTFSGVLKKNLFVPEDFGTRFLGSYEIDDRAFTTGNLGNTFVIRKWEMEFPDVGIKIAGNEGQIKTDTLGYGIDFSSATETQNRFGLSRPVSLVSARIAQNSGVSFISGGRLFTPTIGVETETWIRVAANSLAGDDIWDGSLTAIGSSDIDVTAANWQADRETHYLQYTSAPKSAPYSDRFFTFIETNGSQATGYSAFSLNAQYLVQGRGLFRYTGNGSNWSWERLTDINVEDDGTTAYFELPRNLLPGNSFRHVIWGKGINGGGTRFPAASPAVAQVTTAGNLQSSFPVTNVSFTQTDADTIVTYESDALRISLSDAANTFIDVDANPATGYRFFQQGADFLIRDTTIYLYKGTGGNDWQWTPMAQGAVTFSGPTKVTIRFPRVFIRERFFNERFRSAFRYGYFSDNSILGGQGTQIFPPDLATQAAFFKESNQPYDLGSIEVFGFGNSILVEAENKGPWPSDQNFFVFMDNPGFDGPRYQVRQLEATHLFRGSELFVYTGTGNNWSWQKIGDVRQRESKRQFYRRWFFPASLVGANVSFLNYIAFADNNAAGGSGTSFAPDTPQGKGNRILPGFVPEDKFPPLVSGNGNLTYLENFVLEQPLLFFDTDNTGTTGYSAFGIGADIRINNGVAYRYVGNGSTWSWEVIEYAQYDDGFSGGFPQGQPFLNASVLGNNRSVKLVSFFDNSASGRPSAVLPDQSSQGIGTSFYRFASVGNGQERIVIDGEDGDWTQPDVDATRNNGLESYNFLTNFSVEIDNGTFFVRIRHNTNFAVHIMEFDLNGDNQADFRLPAPAPFSFRELQPLIEAQTGRNIGFTAYNRAENVWEAGFPVDWLGNGANVGLRYIMETGFGDVVETYPRLNQPFLKVPLP